MNNSLHIPILTSNAYGVSVKQITDLYWGEMLRKFWYVLLLFSVPLGIKVYKDANQPFPFNFVLPMILLGVVLFVRYRFMNSIKSNPTLSRTTTFGLFHDRLEFTDSDNNYRIYSLCDMHKLSKRRIGYILRMNNKQSILIPADCFRTELDRQHFEEILKRG